MGFTDDDEDDQWALQALTEAAVLLGDCPGAAQLVEETRTKLANSSACSKEKGFSKSLREVVPPTTLDSTLSERHTTLAAVCVGAALSRAARRSETVTNPDQINMLSFLSAELSEDGCWAPQKGEIVGMLKQWKHEKTAHLKAVRETAHQDLMTSMMEEISVLMATLANAKMMISGKTGFTTGASPASKAVQL